MTDGLISLLSILATIIGSSWYFHRELHSDMRGFREEMRAQSVRSDEIYKHFNEEIKTQSMRSDELYKIFTEEMTNQHVRSDNLYQMFIDLLKERKK